jgi:hypothetical protein
VRDVRRFPALKEGRSDNDPRPPPDASVQIGRGGEEETIDDRS